MALDSEKAGADIDDSLLSEFFCAAANNDNCDPTKIGVADPNFLIGRAVMDVLGPCVARIFADNGDRPPEPNE